MKRCHTATADSAARSVFSALVPAPRTADFKFPATELAPKLCGAQTPGEFVGLLRQLKEWSGLTFRQIETRAQHYGDCLPKSTVAATLERDALPRQEFLKAFVRACGCDPALWVHTRRSLAVAAVEPAGDSPSGGADERQLPLRAENLEGCDQELGRLPMVALMLEVPCDEAEQAIERLVEVDLRESTGLRRHRIHDLVRLLARESPESHSSGDAALRVTVCLWA
jgi:hypothetical protein